MYQMLGFIDDTNPGTPGNIRYWKNIVNEDFLNELRYKLDCNLNFNLLKKKIFLKFY